MGLVATWLNGIGLRSVVPTFEAAGIVSPAHLADLDVSYFESLGVTDPDDRRKLFYLVQRIKLAVNNNKDPSKGKSPTAEERVDAVISDNFVSQDERDTKSKSKKGTEHGFLEEKKVETEARRSKRIIAKKKKSSKVSSKEDNDSDSDPSPSLLQKPGSMSRIKRAIDSKKKSKKNKDDTKKEKSSRSLAKKTGSSSEAQRKAKTKKEKVPKLG